MLPISILLRMGSEYANLELSDATCSSPALETLIDLWQSLDLVRSVSVVVQESKHDTHLALGYSATEHKSIEAMNALSARIPSSLVLEDTPINTLLNFFGNKWSVAQPDSTCIGLALYRNFLGRYPVFVNFQLEQPVILVNYQIQHLQTMMVGISGLALSVIRQIHFIEDFRQFVTGPAQPADASPIVQGASKDVGSSMNINRKNISSLTEMERSVLEFMAMGLTNGEIAKETYQSSSTIRNMSSRIYNKIGARNRQEAISIYVSTINHAILVPPTGI